MHGDSAVIEMFWFPEQFLIFSAPSVWNRRKSETRFPVKTFLAWKDRFTGRAVPLHYRTRKNIKNLDFYPKTTAFSLRKQPGVLSCFYFVGTFNSHRGNNNGENCRTKSPPLYYIFMFFSLKYRTNTRAGFVLRWGCHQSTYTSSQSRSVERSARNGWFFTNKYKCLFLSSL